MLAPFPPISMQRDYDRPFKSYTQTSAANLPLSFYGSSAHMAMAGYHLQPHHDPMAHPNNAGVMGMQMPSNPAISQPSATMPKPPSAPSDHLTDISDATPNRNPQPGDLDSNGNSSGSEGAQIVKVESQNAVTSSSPPRHDNGDGSDSEGDDDDGRLPPKKRQHQVPLEHKDEAYWGKRRKNNESAKRSRDARRMKEEQIAMRVVYLEQENLQLRTEVAMLRSKIEEYRCMLYSA